ncbi:MAG: phosphate acyltransferase, partial [Rhodospirillales bacterium]|nr:phosphate acyltransferase [Rhodospirillales bacterium]
LSLLITARGAFFLCDTYVNLDPTADQVVKLTLMAAEAVRRIGITPKIALLSHSNFGNAPDASSRKMREAVAMLHRCAPDLEVEGEMHADAAIDETLRENIFPNSRLKGTANLLVMPTIDASNIAFNMSKVLAEGLPVGPILLGAARPAHIVTPSITQRGLVNMCAIAVVEAQISGKTGETP